MIKNAPMVFCNFCGRPETAVDLMVASSEDLHICNDCIEICVKSLLEFRAGKVEKPLKEQHQAVPSSNYKNFTVGTRA